MIAALACGMAVLGQAPGAGAQAAGDMEAQFAARVTAERRAVGRVALATEGDLVAVARQHSAAMAASNQLYHNTSLGQHVQGWQLVAENVGTGSTVDQIHRALMASPPHRADIVDARFTGIGIGVVQSGGTLWVTQVFRRSAGGSAPAPVPPTPVSPSPEPRPDPAPGPPSPADPAPPAEPAGAVPAARATETRAARRAMPPASVPTTTIALASTPTTAPPATEASVDLSEVAASTTVPIRPVPVAGLVAALLWAAAAWMLKVTIGRRFRPARS